LPVLDEMLVTGRFDLLHNETVKEQLRDYVALQSGGPGTPTARSR
jgi:hypothetical protein